ncbi:MAG: hypothetical protein N2999_03500 [Proteobacteria bacterium]|nr:hypothetical protein [Pseudomonadota bacterium]
MKKVFAFFLFFLLLTGISFAKYFKQPLYSDKELGNITINDEKKIREILKDSEQNLNVVLNYIKTLIFTAGYVTAEQDKVFKEVLAKIDEKDRKALQDILKSHLSENKIEIKVIDINSREYYLPIDPLENGAK